MAFLDLETRQTHQLGPSGADVSIVSFAAAPDGFALDLVRERSRNDVWLMRTP